MAKPLKIQIVEWLAPLSQMNSIGVVANLRRMRLAIVFSQPLPARSGDAAWAQ